MSWRNQDRDSPGCRTNCSLLSLGPESDNQIDMKSAKRQRATSPKGRRKRHYQKDRASLPAKRVSTISATQAARSFSDLLNRIHYGGEAFVVERGGEPICEISPVGPLRFTGANLLALLRSLPKPDAGFWDAVRKATRQETSVPQSPWER